MAVGARVLQAAVGGGQQLRSGRETEVPATSRAAFRSFRASQDVLGAERDKRHAAWAEGHAAVRPKRRGDQSQNLKPCNDVSSRRAVHQKVQRVCGTSLVDRGPDTVVVNVVAPQGLS